MAKLKSFETIKRELGKPCKVDKCTDKLTHVHGPGEHVLCRKHQLNLIENGGTGRLDRIHTFHRTWSCSECGWEALEDTRLINATDDEMTRKTIARVLIHADHHTTAKADGGDDSAENIKCLCIVCHAIKTILNGDHLKKKAS